MEPLLTPFMVEGLYNIRDIKSVFGKEDGKLNYF